MSLFLNLMSDASLFQVMHLLQDIQEEDCAFLTAFCQVCAILICPINDDAHFYHLTKIVLSRIPDCEVPFLLL